MRLLETLNRILGASLDRTVLKKTISEEKISGDRSTYVTYDGKTYNVARGVSHQTVQQMIKEGTLIPQ